MFFSVLLHYDKHLRYTAYLLWHIWSKEMETAPKSRSEAASTLLAFGCDLEENERVYSL